MTSNDRSARVIFVNRFFYPDHSATSQMLTGLAFGLADRGRNIHVVTGRDRYKQGGEPLPADEVAYGVHVHRVASRGAARKNLAERVGDYLSFYAAAGASIARVARRGDIVVVKTDPPLMSLIAGPILARRKARLINWLQDVYPEVAGELHLPLLRGPLGGAVARLRDLSLRGAAANVVLGTRMADRLAERGISRKSFRVIPNWSDDEAIDPVPHEQNPLRREWNLDGKFVVGYSGNLGRPHEYETLLGAAERLRSDSRFVFLFVGDGFHQRELRQRVERTGLADRFRFHPYQEQAALKFSLSAADVHWLSLRPQLEGLIVPSKFYGIAAAGRPTVAITAADGEIARLVGEHRCGVQVDPGDSEGLARCLVHLADRPEEVALLGRNAREMLTTHFSRRRIVERWIDLLDEVSA